MQDLREDSEELMIIAPGVAVLDLWRSSVRQCAVDTDVAPFLLRHPYQSASALVVKDDSLAEGSDQPVIAAKRVRSRKRKFKPNPPQLEANNRHSQALPQLEAALDAVQTWMKSHGAETLRQAMERAGSSAGCVAAQQREVENATQQACVTGSQEEEPHEQQEAAGHEEHQQQQASGNVVQPDFVALGAMQHVVRPKFQWLEPPNSSPCNLFGSLITNNTGAARCATAGEWQVVVPPGSSFMMSNNIRQLDRLIPGGWGGEEVGKRLRRRLNWIKW
jgi:hypothetical protein